MPIYKMDGKKDGLQKYRVRINFTDSSGKSKQIDRVAYGKEVAKELERQLAYNLSDETIKKITLQQLYDEYIAVKKFEVRENSMRTIIGRLELYVLPKLQDYIFRATKVETIYRNLYKCQKANRKTFIKYETKYLR